MKRFEGMRYVAWGYIVGALVLGDVVPRVRLGWVTNELGPDEVIAFLSAVSSGMMAFTGIIFSLLCIVLQFASSAYSPHLVTMLVRNPVIRHAGGVFTGTFLYSLMALRGVGAVGGMTSTLTLFTAFAWLLGSVYLLLQLVGVFASLSITRVLDMLGESGAREIDRVYAHPYSEQAELRNRQGRVSASAGRTMQTVVHRGRPLYLLSIDAPRLVELARAADAVIRIPIAIGDSVTAGVRIAYVEGASGVVSEEALRSAIVLGADRTFERGPKHAMRMLVDIGIRALSPAINDPTTAVHVVDQLEALLEKLGQAHLDIGVARDASGTTRLVHEGVPTWDEYLELGVTELQQYGAGALQLERRLAALLALLATTLPDERRPAVERMAAEHIAAVRRQFPEGPLRSRAERVDRQGLGRDATAH